MNFLKYIILLIISPKEGWKDIHKYSIPNSLLIRKLYHPLLAVLAISSFVPFVFSYSGVSLQTVIINAMLDFVKFFLAFYMVSYLLSIIFATEFKQKHELNKLNNFIVFDLAVLVIFNVLRNLMPGFPFFEVIPLYIIYVIVRAMKYLEITEKRHISFITASSALLLLIPDGIKFVLDLFIPDFN